MDLNQSRFNMVHQQVKTWDVLNPTLLDLMLQIPREQFVPETLKHLAYSDTFLPMGHNQVMLPPKIVGRVVQALNIKDSDVVLEIGTGTGYITQLLSRLAKKVFSIEIIQELHHQAKQNLTLQHTQNVELIEGDGVLGCPKLGPFDVILVTGSMPYLPNQYNDQLKNGGRLVAFIGDSPAMSALLRTKNENFIDELLFETVVPALINAKEPSRFEF